MTSVFLLLVAWATPWDSAPNLESPWGIQVSEERREARENFFEEISRSQEPRDSEFRSTSLSRIRNDDLGPITDTPADDDLKGSEALSRLPWNRYETSVRSAPNELLWPVANGLISSGFGPRGGGFHEGIDIKARSGAPIRAVAAGRVVFSGPISGYGRTLVLAHGGGMATVYAHNEQNLMSVGDRVRQGETLAFVGSSGHATGSHLHFEIRLKGKPQNPLGYSFARAPEATAQKN